MFVCISSYVHIDAEKPMCKYFSSSTAAGISSLKNIYKHTYFKDFDICYDIHFCLFIKLYHVAVHAIEFFSSLIDSNK